MARFYSEIGFGITAETAPGVWEDAIVVKKYYGSVLRNSLRSSDSNGVNNNTVVNNSISIMANEYAFSHLKSLRYVKFEGELWEIDTIEVQRPRLILNLGGIYNGPESTTPNAA